MVQRMTDSGRRVRFNVMAAVEIKMVTLMEWLRVKVPATIQKAITWLN